MPQGILKYYFIGKTSQVATILTIIMALAFLFIIITVNIGRLGEVKTLTSNAADGAALMLASQIGSYSKYLNIYVDRQAGTNKCDFHWRKFLLDIVPFVMEFVGIHLPLVDGPVVGPMGPLPLTKVMSRYAKALVWGGAARLVRRVGDLLSKSFAKDLQNTLEGGNIPPEVEYRELAILYALQNTVTDPNMVQDNDPRHPDVDEDGDTTDSVSAFEVWYEYRMDELPTYYLGLNEMLRRLYWHVIHPFRSFLVGYEATEWYIPIDLPPPCDGCWDPSFYQPIFQYGFLGFLRNLGFTGTGMNGLQELLGTIEYRYEQEGWPDPFPWYEPTADCSGENIKNDECRYLRMVRFLEAFDNIDMYGDNCDNPSFIKRVYQGCKGFSYLRLFSQWFRELYNAWPPKDTPGWLPPTPPGWSADIESGVAHWIAGLRGIAGFNGSWAVPPGPPLTIPQIMAALNAARQRLQWSSIDEAMLILRYFPIEVGNLTDEVEFPCFSCYISNYKEDRLYCNEIPRDCNPDNFNYNTQWYADPWDTDEEYINGEDDDGDGETDEMDERLGYDLKDWIDEMDHWWKDLGPAYYHWKDSGGWHTVRVYVDRLFLPYIQESDGYWGWGTCYEIIGSSANVKVSVKRYDEKKETPLWNFVYRRNLDPSQEQRETNLLATLNSVGDVYPAPNGDDRLDYWDLWESRDPDNPSREDTPWGAMLALVDEFGIESRAQANYDIDYPAGENLDNPYLLTLDRIRLTNIDDNVYFLLLEETPPSCGTGGCQRDLGEDKITCPEDCLLDSCGLDADGDGDLCDYLLRENYRNCPNDCPEGCYVNDVCEPWRNEEYPCPDCPAPIECGNGTCERPAEDADNCNKDNGGDCDEVCGDTICEGDETPENCSADCFCNNNCVCESGLGETWESCPWDCEPIHSCGNGFCGCNECLTGYCQQHDWPVDCSMDCSPY